VTTGINQSITYKLSADTVESKLADETVILHLRSGTYFGLDAVGTVVWAALKTGAQSSADIVQAVSNAYPDAPDTVSADVQAFLGSLLEHQLIEAA
jgi:hypothetical protein